MQQMSAVASDAGEQTLIGISTDAVNVIILLTANVLQ